MAVATRKATVRKTTTVKAAAVKAAAPKVTRAPRVRKTPITLIVGTRVASTGLSRVTADSRALTLQQTNVKLPKGVSGERAASILTAAGFKVTQVTWTAASAKLRDQAAKAAGKEADGDE